MKDVDIIDFDRFGGRRYGGGRSRKNVWILIIILIAAGVYFGGSIYFNRHFMPNTRVNGHKVSFETAAGTEKKLAREISDYTLTIQERGGKTEKIRGSEVGVKADFGNKVSDAVRQQKGFTWIVTAWKQKDITLTDLAEYDEDELETAVEKLDCADGGNMTKSRNATISAKQTNGKFTIVDAVYGTELDTDSLQKAVSKAVGSLEDTLNLSKAGVYQEPEYTKDSKEVKAALDTVQKMTDMTVTYDMGDAEPVVCDGTRIRSWLKIDKDMNVSVSSSKVKAFVKAFAKKYNTAYSYRKFRTADGRTITTAGGPYGWMLDQSAEAGALLKEVKAGKDVSRKPNWKQTAVSHKSPDYGTTYAEVDIANQRMYYFVNGSQVMSSDVVTGDVTKGRGTPQGVFSVMYKQRNGTLVGENYSSPVDYWMPFDANVGFHDARWRSSFGGSIYQGDGSHGCVNMPKWAAAKLYSMIKKDCPVIVHA